MAQYSPRQELMGGAELVIYREHIDSIWGVGNIVVKSRAFILGATALILPCFFPLLL